MKLLMKNNWYSRKLSKTLHVASTLSLLPDSERPVWTYSDVELSTSNQRVAIAALAWDRWEHEDRLDVRRRRCIFSSKMTWEVWGSIKQTLVLGSGSRQHKNRDEYCLVFMHTLYKYTEWSESHNFAPAVCVRHCQLFERPRRGLDYLRFRDCWGALGGSRRWSFASMGRAKLANQNIYS